ncbi:MAG: glycosyltransferase family 4 protein [Candidatus Freyarchaeota archaeon]
MKVVVGHHLWSRVGGGELVSAYVVKTLLEAGHEVSVATTSGFEKEKYAEWFNLDLGKIRTYTLLPKLLPMFAIYQRLGFYVPLGRAIKKEKPDKVFVDNELYKPVIKLKKELGFKLLEYIHFPFHAVKFLKFEPSKKEELYKKYFMDVEGYHRKYEKGFWKIYFEVFLKLYDRVARDNPFEVADVVMANSRYIAKLIRLLWGNDPIVIHPPVRTDDFKPLCGRSFEDRDDSVVMIGRITPEKRIDEVIKAISLSQTKPVLRVVGGLIPANMPYKAKLEKMAEEMGVKLEFYPNVHRKELVDIATSSKVFVHAAIGEHFGIAVVEGMAAGCPVIVHRSGGSYEDITDCGNYGLSFDSVEELAEHIDKLLTEPKLWKIYHEKSLNRAMFFSEQGFAEKLLKIVESG